MLANAANQDLLAKITSDLQGLSKTLAMPTPKSQTKSSKPLGERDVNTVATPNNKATNGSKKRKSSSANSDADAGSQPPAAKKAQLAAAAASKNDVSSIHLDGEATQSVPVYDTCDDMRTKINRYMRETVGASNAGLVKLINAAAYPDTNEASAHQLKTFLTGKRGPTRGAESKVFYGAYVFFEKLRVKQDKKKSKKREEMEDVWGSKGMRLQDTSRHGILALPGEKPTEDQFGRLHFMRSGR